VQLLPGDKILVVSDYRLSLYDTLSVEATADIPSPDSFTWPSSYPTWEILFEIRGISQLYCCGNTNESRLILGTRRCIYGIIIPCHITAGSRPKMVQLMPLESYFGSNMCHFGYNSAVMIYSPYLLLHYFNYPWLEGSSESPVGSSNSLVREIDKKTWRRPRYSAFDECSGRVVVEAGNAVVAYDFSKL